MPITGTRRHTALGIMAVTAGIAVLGGEMAWPAARARTTIPGLEARVVAINIPGASAIAQVGTFLNVPLIWRPGSRRSDGVIW
jgi:hypothetical protein